MGRSRLGTHLLPHKELHETGSKSRPMDRQRDGDNQVQVRGRELPVQDGPPALSAGNRVQAHQNSKGDVDLRALDKAILELFDQSGLHIVAHDTKSHLLYTEHGPTGKTLSEATQRALERVFFRAGRRLPT